LRCSLIQRAPKSARSAGSISSLEAKPTRPRVARPVTKIFTQDHSEVVLALPVRDAVLVVEVFHDARLGALCTMAPKVAAHAPFAEILGPMQDGGRVWVCADHEDAAGETAQAIEQRARTIIIVPGRT
jgi:hypothetical protein